MAKQARSVQRNVKIAPCMKQLMTALATAREISITGLLMRALDAYAAPEVGDGGDNDKHTASHRSEPFCGLHALSGARSRHRRARSSQAEAWAAFREWCLLHDLKGNTSADDFGVTPLLMCQIKQIAVRARGN